MQAQPSVPSSAKVPPAIVAGRKLNWKKADVEPLKLKAGDEFIGTLTAITDKEHTDKLTGEVAMLKNYHFTMLDGEGREVSQKVFTADAGFKNLLYMAKVEIGETIRVIKNAKKDIGGGRTVNAYELFRLV